MRRTSTLITLGILFCGCGGPEPELGEELEQWAGQAKVPTTVAIVGQQFTINGQLTYPKTAVQGRLMNVRMVNAVFEDQARPSFDAAANTQAFIQHLPQYVASGARAFTLCLQGGSPGYEGAVNSAFNPDGSLRPTYLDRVASVIRAADAQGAVVILGLFYQRQDQVLVSQAAVQMGVRNAARWVQQQGFKNVLLEIANEFGHPGYDHAVLKTASGIASLIKLARAAAPGLYVSASGLGQGTLPQSVAQAADFLLIHFNNTGVGDYAARVAALKSYGKPIVCNEDNKIGGQGVAALKAATQAGASWGFMHIDLNQHLPFQFMGPADDPAVYSALKQLATPPSAQGLKVTSLTLINADTDKPVAGFNPIASGATIRLSTVGTIRLNVRANTSPATVGSVRFGLGGAASYRLENVAPYALAGDTGGDYLAWTPATGKHTITATPYPQKSGKGSAGQPLSLTLVIKP